MSPVRAPPEDAIQPSARLIAFAVSVVRSKPQELSIGEYIRLLRQHVAKGRRQNALSSTYRYLDGSSYWRSELDRTKDELAVAKDEVIDLQREIDGLRGKLDTSKTTSPSKKRKKADEDTIPVPRAPKKSRRDASPDRREPLAFDSHLEREFDEAGEIGRTLLRTVFRIHTSLRSHNQVEPAKLAFYLADAASSIPQIVEREVKGAIKDDADNNIRLKSALTFAGRAVSSVLIAFNKLSSFPENANLQGKCVYAVVTMFRDLLICLEHLSSNEVSKLVTAENAAKKAAAEKSKGKSKAAKPGNVKESAALSMFATFLSGMIEMLDPKSGTNLPLFEGFAYCVLDKLGSRLFTVVFGHSRAPTLEEEILSGNPNDDIEDDQASPSAKDVDLEQKQIRLEAPYLIHLLSRLIAAAPSHLGSFKGGKAAKSKQGSNKSVTKAALAITAKECLQRTLVNCVFGTEGMSEDDPFMDSLKMPNAGQGTIAMPKVKEADVQEWFTEELWRLLGWEILQTQGDI